MSSADPPSSDFPEQQSDYHLAVTSDPTAEEIAVLSWMERFAFRFVHRMNQGSWKRFWTWCQRVLGAGWIHLATYNLIRVYGLEHVEAVSHERPILLVANHRSFFDMYTVSTVLFRRTRWPKKLFFPVRGRFFYESPLGLLVNMLMGWWSMYPPIFAANDKRLFDKYSVRRLAELCRTGAGHVIGFHPEGTRNRSSDPYSYLRAQPGVGKLIKDAAPQVIPVFIAGLGNNLPRQILGNWTGGEAVRVHFGARLELSEYLSKKDHVRTYKEISDFVMSKIAELGEADRALFQSQIANLKPQVKERELST
ncbi:MAG TPA: lysophospholipid acyltransferase family protein [Pyrinomonadaceae bacterium]|jgi:1-acyl-sn-glycerol-3-phosphate acyltransferase|nr:lysophospholipid acyltransferase family protein [Pyrinomonadaceae bacterium]